MDLQDILLVAFSSSLDIEGKQMSNSDDLGLPSVTKLLLFSNWDI